MLIYTQFHTKLLFVIQNLILQITKIIQFKTLFECKFNGIILIAHNLHFIGQPNGQSWNSAYVCDM
jgi:hypothetical protein